MQEQLAKAVIEFLRANPEHIEETRLWELTSETLVEVIYQLLTESK